MGFRILLVSVVAGLGLTLPSGKQVGEWHGSARAWVDARLADWDAPVLEEGDAFVVSAEPVAVPAPAPVAVPAAAPVSSPVAAEAPAAPAVTIAPTVAPADIDALTDLGFLGFDDADLDPTPTLTPTPTPTPAQTPAQTPAPAPVVDNSDADFDAAQGDFIVEFVAQQAAAFAAEIASAPVVEQVAAPAVEPESTDAAFAAAQEEFVTGFVAERIAAEKAKATPAPEVARVEPVDDGEDLYSDLAYVLNQGAEGLEPTPTPAAAASVVERAGEGRPSDRDGRLTNAVRLTRDAVYAWANLLHGPAVVTIGR